MVTLAPDALVWLAREWERAIDSARARDDAATFSGIVGDAQHRAEGGYHISREDQPASNYSVGQFSDDREGRSDLAAAVDMTMDPSSMMLVTKRLVEAWLVQDPRLANVRAFNGTLDGVTAWRWDASAAPDDPSPSDGSHLWHVHLEIFRKYADDWATALNVLSVITGGNDMAIDANDLKLIVENVANAIARGTWRDGYVATTFDPAYRPTAEAPMPTLAEIAQGVTALKVQVTALASRPVATVDLGDGGREALAGLTAKVDRIVAALEAAGAGLGKADGK